MRIIFCGESFPPARALLKKRLPTDELVVWSGASRDIDGIDVLIPLMFRVDAELIQRTRPRLIQQWGSGLDGVDLRAAELQNVPVANVPALGGNAESVAEHIILLMLSVLRKIPEARTNLELRVLGAPMGRMLAGRTVCLWGLGSIAEAVARRLRAFDVKLVGITREPTTHKMASFGLEACYSTRDYAEALRCSDLLVVCLRLCEATRGIIDATVLAALPAGACLVNAARGPLVDYQALCAALASGRLGGAGLDVYEAEPVAPNDPILALPNVIATPHIAGVTDRSYGEIADEVAGNIERLRRGEALLNRAV
jgi:phosphoglycerate dehydrogenase-like enzyme